jgi:hypothetical protein
MEDLFLKNRATRNTGRAIIKKIITAMGWISRTGLSGEGNAARRGKKKMALATPMTLRMTKMVRLFPAGEVKMDQALTL